MDKNELIQLASNRNFISGIYNYCDRWCERCPFTGKCLVFATERADGNFDDAEVNDINNARFWQKLEAIFKEVRQMIVEWAEEEGIDVESLEAEGIQAEREELKYKAKHHDLSVAAKNYALAVQRWFEEEFAVEQSVHDDITGKARSAADEIDVSDAIEVIRWYQFFVAAKVYRSLMGFEHQAAMDDEPLDEDPFGADPFDDDEQDLDQILAETARNDSNGSAKIALIAIDRSLSAWRIMKGYLPEKSESIVSLLVQLERLRRGLEQEFPEARDFIRPGFDESDSELVS
jgi:hypothetical protein